MEIELKFLIQPDAINKFIDTLENSCFSVEKQSSLQLRNGYFDTSDNDLRTFDIGLRIRSAQCDVGEDYAEQTVKLAGKDVGGLHQRPEHNVDLQIPAKMHANLSLFDAAIWPDGFSVDKIQPQLALQFETDFHRQRWLVSMPSGSIIECVLDSGEIRANEQTALISEIELELVSGQSDDLFLLAQFISSTVPVRLGFQSKAARGYQLLAGKILRCKELKTVKITNKTSVERSVSKSLNYALSFVQHHEQVFCNSLSPKSLRRVIDGWSMLIHTLELFSEHVEQRQVTDFIEGFKSIRAKHKWVDAFYQMAHLQSRKSPYRNDIENSDFLTGLMAQQQLSEQKLMKAARFFSSPEYNQLLLNFIKWLNNKSWRGEIKLSQLKKLSTAQHEIAGDWLDGAWQSLRSSLKAYRENPDKANLVALYWPLAESLLTGMVVGGLYGEAWEKYRNGQHDVLIGCEEFLLLTRLETILSSDDLDEAEVADYLSWVRSKQKSLNMALGASLSNIGQRRAFWQ